jgi:alanine racemase
MSLTSPPPFRPRHFPYVEINLDHLLHNLNQLRATLPPSTGILAVVKDNAYGCGSVMVSRLLERNGVGFFAVARTSEARVLREAGVESPILVLGPALPADIVWGASSGVQFTLSDLADLTIWKQLDLPIRFHLEIDTGMGRLGLLPGEIDKLILELSGWPNLIFEGAFTHFARSDEPDNEPTALQRIRFRKAMVALDASGLRPPIIHVANSAAITHQTVMECTMVRPGIALYGCRPDPGRDFPLDLKPVLSLKGRVVKIKHVPAGTPVSYGGTYVTKTDTAIATIDIGYGQGLPRQLGNRGTIIIKGKRYVIAGRITMDFLMVDAGAAPEFVVGDEAVAVGQQGNEKISPDDIALLCHTIGYEILCSISSRIDRSFILNGREIHYEPSRPY